MHDFRRLRVWQQARQLNLRVDAVTRSFSRRDRGVVASQLRRSAASIPATIAEGCGKSSRAETIRYLQMASGSAYETENHLIIAGDLNYLSQAEQHQLLSEVTSIKRMLARLIMNLP